MLYLALLYTIVTAFCLWAGLIFYSIFDRIGKNTDHPPPDRPVICYLLSGMILTTALAQWIVLFVPLNFTALLLFILPLFILLSLILRQSLILSWKKILYGPLRHPFFLPCFAIFLFMILVLNAGPTVMDDTDSYHIQMVKWAQEYGTVPGIANLHLRYGFNSSWFLSIALLLPKIKGVNHYMALNGLLSCWLSYYLLFKIFAAWSPAASAKQINTIFAVFVVLILGLAAWPMLRGNAASANYDFISTCCIIVLFIEAASTGMTTASRTISSSIAPTLASDSTAAVPTAVSKVTPSVHPSLRPEWIVWPFFLSTVKLINFVLILFCLFWLIRTFRKQTLYICLGAAAFILIPFGIRNCLLSGYLLFPLYQIDLFSFDWKVSRPLVVELMDYIEYFNRSNGDSQAVIDLPFTAWIKVWQHNLFSYDKVITDLSIGCWLVMLATWKKWTRAFSPSYNLFLLTLFLMLITWLIIAPDPRFIYGALLASIFTGIIALPGRASIRQCRRLATIGLITVSAGIFIHTTYKMSTHAEYRNWLLPHPLPVPVTKKLVVDGIELRIPEKALDNWNPRCYDQQLPCLYMLNPFLHARGKKISDGFRADEGEHPENAVGEYKIKKI